MSRWTKAVDNFFERQAANAASGKEPLTFGELRKAVEQESNAKLEKLDYELVKPNTGSIDLTTKSAPMPTLEQVRELRKTLENGLSYSFNTATNQRFHVDAKPTQASSLNVAYGSDGKMRGLDFTFTK